jgi:hypothetical protein
MASATVRKLAEARELLKQAQHEEQESEARLKRVKHEVTAVLPLEDSQVSVFSFQGPKQQKPPAGPPWQMEAGRQHAIAQLQLER